MSSKIKRKVTVDNSKENDDQPRRPSVFERLGPNANISSAPADRHSRTEQNEKCRNWLRSGSCVYGNNCRYQHDPFPQSSRRSKSEKVDAEEKDLRHKVKVKRDEPKESRTESISPKRKGNKRSTSRSRKGEHESKIKSTVVVSRPRSPNTAPIDSGDIKKSSEANWEDNSDDWPMDAAQLEFKEEFTLIRKRQQLKREIELELQKERLRDEHVTITKTVSFSESSSSSSSSDSGSVSSSSSSSSSSDEDSDDSSSSSSSSSSSDSRHMQAKKKGKKSAKDGGTFEKPYEVGKVKEDFDKVKVGRSIKAQKMRSPSPLESRGLGKKGREKRKESPLSPRRRGNSDRSIVNFRMKGPRTPSPSPVVSKKKRQWGQSSSTDSRSVDMHRRGGKRHKKKRDVSRVDKFKSNRGPTPPPLSSPNRTALMPAMASKKSKQREDGKSRHRGRDSPPLMLPRNLSSSKLGNTSRYVADEKLEEKHRPNDYPKVYSRKESEEMLPVHKRTDSHDRGSKRGRASPRKEGRKSSLSPQKDRTDRRKFPGDLDKKRDLHEDSPRLQDSRRENPYRAGNSQFEKRGLDQKVKRGISPEAKKGREDRNRDYNQKNRNTEYDAMSWAADHRKGGRPTPEGRGRQDTRGQPQPPLSDREPERKKRKEDPERTRLPSPSRSQSPIHSHHSIHEIEPLTGNRGGIYDPEVERDYSYNYDPLHESYLNERMLPADFETDVIRGSMYPAETYPEPRYRRDSKEPVSVPDRYGARDVMSPRNIVLHRDVIAMPTRSEDYLPDVALEDREYEERWPRGRNRDNWDSYTTLPPPHIPAGLEEDRYGMPRRRRVSPEWQRGGRIEERETTSGTGHRQVGRGHLPREGRSRSPNKSGNRGSWNERGNRHDSRHEEVPKAVDDHKSRNRKDKSKRKEELVEVKPFAKEKAPRRAHSPSPQLKETKRRKDAEVPDAVLLSEKSNYKRNKDDPKGESKLLSRMHKHKKLDVSSPRSDVSHSSLLPSEKGDSVKSTESRNKEKEERKSRRNEDTARGEDDFSDWSDGDDDLLNRDDYMDPDETTDAKVRVKVEDDGSSTSKRRDKHSKEMPTTKKIKESNARTSSRDRSAEETSHSKETKNQEVKEESFSAKEDNATDVDEYITAESVDYDPISDDELDALIEEPEDTTVSKETLEPEKSKIVDALDVNWSVLMSEPKPDPKPGSARRRFKAAHVLSRIGFSQVLAGPSFSEKIITACQKQIEKECEEIEDTTSEDTKEEKKFVMEHQIAAFHVAIAHTKKDRVNLFNQVGSYRRALCARRDLQIRKLLCKPINKFATCSSVPYSPQYGLVDKDLYKKSLELLRKPQEVTPKPINVC